jgi:PAS domain S-box-containing protein
MHWRYSLLQRLTKELFDSSSDSLFILDPRKAIQEANPQAKMLFGASRVATGNCFSALGASDNDRIEIETALADCAKIGTAQNETLLTPSSGLRVPFLVSLNAIYSADGVAHCFLIRANKLSESIKHLRLNFDIPRLLSSVQDGIFIIDFKTRIIVDCNAGASLLSGYLRDELVGKSSRLLYSSDDEYARSGDFFSSKILSEGFFFDKLHFMHKSGIIVECMVYILPHYDEASDVDFLFALVRDKTDQCVRRATVAATSRKLEELSQRLSETTAGIEKARNHTRNIGGLGLTPRQEEIANAIVNGRSAKEIGAIIDVAPSTINNHIAAIYRKLNANSRIDLARILGLD